MRNRFTNSSVHAPTQLVAVVGSDELISRLYRDPNANYSFDLRRADTHIEPEPSFNPDDLRSIVKLAQVLAFVIADDGWLRSESSGAILSLSHELDEITRRWDGA